MNMTRRFDDLMLGSVELFCLSAEAETFTAAAARAGVTPAAVSRAVSRLEARLGVRLFQRTTRRVRLTEDGRAYFEQCRSALDQLIEAERELSGQQRTPAGTVRISVPTPFGHYRILPLVPRFRERYPQVQVDVHISNRNIDFVAEGYDLAIRGRTQTDSGLVARKLEDAALVVVASPDYLARAGEPESLEGLQRHDCVQFVLPSSGQHVPWLFRRDGQDVQVATEGGSACSEDLLGTVTLARHGGGLLQTYRFIVEQDLRDGQLREVLMPFAGRSRPFSLLYPDRRHMPLRVRVFIEFLLATLSPQAQSIAS